MVAVHNVQTLQILTIHFTHFTHPHTGKNTTLSVTYCLLKYLCGLKICGSEHKTAVWIQNMEYATAWHYARGSAALLNF